MSNRCPRCQSVFTDQPTLFRHLEQGCKRPLPGVNTAQRTGIDVGRCTQPETYMLLHFQVLVAPIKWQARLPQRLQE